MLKKVFYMNINDIFERLFNYFQASTIRELSEKINMSESTVSKWRQRESVNAIRKKCRELGIYNDIFGDLNMQNIQNQIIDTQNGINSFNNFAVNKQNIDTKNILQDEEVIKVIKSITPIIEDDKIKKENFIKYLKKWLIDNI
jgi:hypothetical protein